MALLLIVYDNLVTRYIYLGAHSRNTDGTKRTWKIYLANTFHIHPQRGRHSLCPNR